MERLPDLNRNEKYERALKRVEELKGFYYNLIAYCLVIPFLIFVNYKTYWGFHWFWFPIFGWGLGLSFHYYHVFVNNGIFGRKWEERKIQEFIQEEENKRWN
ncbi:MAG: 2TM domain-containing protein [Flavobacteriaceae bacterium]|tara:strand:- start:4169 stop:4474 length:306 start_codon:yes stop_codon:yes gene_type:complete